MIFAILFTVNPIYAGQNEYDDCLLKHLINAKVDVATQIMIGACKENYKEFTIISEKRKKYNECLLEYLPGMESSDAVIEIQNVCARKHL
jgi:hypothetical protein